MPIMGEMQAEITRDVIATLYGLDLEQDSREGLFDYRCEIQLGFIEDGKPEDLYLLNLNVPFGRVQASKEEWQALLGRLAAKLGDNYRPASWNEIRTFMRAEAAMEMLASIPKQAMGQA